MSAARKIAPLLAASVVALAPFAGCGGSVVQGGDAGANDAAPVPTGSTTVSACVDVGGRCGPTPDLPCPADEERIEGRCEELAPCCKKLPPLGPGQCRVASDCATQNVPGRPAGSGACTAGACACDASSIALSNGRCGPALLDGESYLCTLGGAFPKSNALCGVIPCDAGGVCVASGASAQCVPPSLRAGEETCVLVSCGAIFCGPGLVCTDATRGVCRPD